MLSERTGRAKTMSDPKSMYDDIEDIENESLADIEAQPYPEVEVPQDTMGDDNA